MKYLYLCILSLFLSACNSSSQNYQNLDYEKIADRITAKTARRIEVETGLRLMGVGGGTVNCIRKLNMSFDCLSEITMGQARELLIYCVNEYLSAINTSDDIRPYLIHYPFTPKDIEIEIFICRYNYSNIPIGSLSVVCEVDGILKYKIRQPDPIIFKQIYEETYEEAIKILTTEESTKR